MRRRQKCDDFRLPGAESFPTVLNLNHISVIFFPDATIHLRQTFNIPLVFIFIGTIYINKVLVCCFPII